MSNIKVKINPSNQLDVSIKRKPSVFVNQSGLIAAQRLGDLLDVDISAREDGSLLIYEESSQKHVSSRILDNQVIDGGTY